MDNMDLLEVKDLDQFRALYTLLVEASSMCTLVRNVYEAHAKRRRQRERKGTSSASRIFTIKTPFFPMNTFVWIQRPRERKGLHTKRTTG